MPRTRPGSSPRVRGTHGWRRMACATSGIIPACAGNTVTKSRQMCCSKDHPRVCGEHVLGEIVYRLAQGSSPRVRGTRPWRDCLSTRAGIIPACAGNTDDADLMLFHDWDHPRVCGEHQLRVLSSSYKAGSSPRVRGTLDSEFFACLSDGIIPACAGNTQTGTKPDTDYRDHPRVCGEHGSEGGAETHPAGSSPRVRGTRSPRFRFSPLSGIIPACAGNTFSPLSVLPAFGDHPRVCGEHRAHQRDGLQA